MSGVVLTYTCGPNDLFMGTTKLKDGIASLTTPLPVCIGGHISGFKTESFVTSTAIDSFQGIEQNVTVDIYPESVLEVNIRKRMAGKETTSEGYEWAFRSNANRDVSVNEQVVLVLTRIPEVGEIEYVSQINYLGNQTSFPSIKLVPGFYELQAFLFKTNGLTIPQEIMRAGGETIIIPEIKFNETFYTGGITRNNEVGGFVEITYEDIKKQKLTIPILGLDSADFTTSTDLEQLNKIDDYVVENIDSFELIFE